MAREVAGQAATRPTIVDTPPFRQLSTREALKLAKSLLAFGYRLRPTGRILRALLAQATRDTPPALGRALRPHYVARGAHHVMVQRFGEAWALERLALAQKVLESASALVDGRE